MPKFDKNLNHIVYTWDDYYEMTLEKYWAVPKWLYNKIMSKAFNFLSKVLFHGLAFNSGTLLSNDPDYNTLVFFHSSYPLKINSEPRKNVQKMIKIYRLKSKSYLKERGHDDFKITNDEFDKILEKHATKYKHFLGGY